MRLLLQAIALAIALSLDTASANDRKQRRINQRLVRKLSTNNSTKLQEENNENNSNTTRCRITVVGTILEADDGAFRLSDEGEEINCIPIIDGKESSRIYPINLPPNFVKKNYRSPTLAL
jgi:hypothetical protein